jgi:aconitate hydratase
MGILPLEFTDGATRKSLNITGSETVDIIGLTENMKPRMKIKAILHRADGSKTEIQLQSRIDTMNELEYYKHGGILQYMVRSMMKE